MKLNKQLSPHEQLELHDIIRSEIIASRKIQANLALVSDQSLRTFMETSLQIKGNIINNYQGFYTKGHR